MLWVVKISREKEGKTKTKIQMSLTLLTYIRFDVQRSLWSLMFTFQIELNGAWDRIQSNNSRVWTQLLRLEEEDVWNSNGDRTIRRGGIVVADKTKRSSQRLTARRSGEERDEGESPTQTFLTFSRSLMTWWYVGSIHFDTLHATHRQPALRTRWARG